MQQQAIMDDLNYHKLIFLNAIFANITEVFSIDYINNKLLKNNLTKGNIKSNIVGS